METSRAQISPDRAEVRRAFPGLADVTYLNVGTYGLTPQPVLDRYLEMIERIAHYGYFVHGAEAVPAVIRAREAVATLLDAPVADVAFGRNATDGINGIFGGLHWEAGDEVLISDQEHPALLYPWLYGQQRGFFAGRMFAVDADPEVTLHNVEALLTARTRLITCSHVSSQTGIRLPVEAICRLAAQANPRPILTLIDGAQAVGQWRVSVRDTGCDFYVSNGHKWLGSPKGSGLLVVRESAREHLTPLYVGGGLEPIEDALGAFARRHDAQRLFEAGTQNLAVLAVLDDAIRWLDDLGWEWIEQRERALSERLRALLATVPRLRMLTPARWEHGSALTSFTVEGTSAHDLHTALWHDRIVTRWVTEHNALRVSTTYFNDDGDLVHLVEALARHCAGEAAPR